MFKKIREQLAKAIPLFISFPSLSFLNPVPDPSTRITQTQPASSLSGTFQIFAGRILPLFYLAFSAAAACLIIYTGIQYIMAAGDPEKAKKAKQQFIQVLVAVALLVVTFFVVGLIVRFVSAVGTNATTGT